MGRPRNTMGDFWRHVDIRGDDECWEWQRYRLPKGYGRFSIGDRAYSSHRLALSTVQEVPDDALVCHSCDNPACCNPKHLFVGTPADNARDRDEKGRHIGPRGETQGRSKLTESEAFFIRYSEMDAKSLADVFEISVMTVYDIRNRRSWGHVA